MSTLNAANNNKCLVYGAAGTVRTSFTDIPHRIPKNHVIVKVHAAGLNPVDAKELIGDKLPPFFGSFVNRVVRGKTIGIDFSGTVVAKKDDDADYQIGDAVFGSLPPLTGTLSEYVVAPKDQICRMPSNLSFAQAAAVPLVGLTALQALQPYTTNGATSIAIVGASGGTGHVALQGAKALGLTTRIAVCSTPNMEFCRSMGATHVIDYKQNQVVQDLTDHVSGEGGVDIIMDCVTSVDANDASNSYPKKLLPLCKMKYIRLGGPTIDWFYAGCERVLPMTCFTGKEKLFWIRFPRSSEELATLGKWCAEDSSDGGQKKLEPHLSLPLVDFSAEAVQQAFDTIMSRRVKGKLVVEIIKPETTAPE
jgi:NADPH:quinone reductase-like Zn-dependent oxidoreductase